MKFLLVLGLALVIFFIFTSIFALKFRSPYKFYFCIGKPGSGKTTTMVKLAFKYKKKGYTVYSNVDIPGCFRVEDSDITYYELKRKSVLLIDEIALIWNNRNFKKFTDEQRSWWKLFRHRQLIIWAFSQAFDADKSIRLLASKIYCVVNYFGIYTVLKEVKRKFPVITENAEGESQITDQYKISPFILAPFGARMYVFIPRWARYFDSFDAAPLPEKEFRYVPAPDLRARRKSKRSGRKSEKKLLLLLNYFSKKWRQRK